MGISKNSVKRIMQSQTDRQISDEGVFLLIDRLETLVKEYTNKAEQILEDNNKIRDIQHMRIKKRIGKQELKQLWE